MSNKKEFKLVPYVYGRLYAEQYYDKVGYGVLFEKSERLYSWNRVLNWLKQEEYLIEYEVGNVDYDTSIVCYKFNRKKLTYEGYLRAVEKGLKKNELVITPMSEFIQQLDTEKDRDKLVDGFEAQFDRPVEYIAPIDRCLKELNKKIMEELNKSTSSDDEGEKKAA